MQINRLRGVLRGIAFLLVTFGMVPIYVLAGLFGQGGRYAMRRVWARAACFTLGVHVRRVGTPFRACPTVYVSNHSSYLDILVLCCHADGIFIAKSEVSGWPLFGFIARLGGTMFIRRHWRFALQQRNDIAARLHEGDSFILFGEGTSTNGLDLKPFKTSLLSVAEPWILDRPVGVQPVSLTYLRLVDGTPIDASNVDLYAWWGAADMAPHLWRVLRLEGVEVEIHFGQPVLSWAVTSRKILGPDLRSQILDRMRESRARVRPAENEDSTAADGTGEAATALS